MGLDCDICDRGNLHTFHCLDNGLEVCRACFGRINTAESTIKKCNEKIKQLGEDVRLCNLPEDLEKLEKLAEDARYFARRIQDEQITYTPENIQRGKERVESRKRRRMEE